MVESAAHLVDHVFPEAPVRQFVLTFPFPLRFLLAAQPKALTRYSVPPRDEEPDIPLLARLYGFSLHAASVCEAHQRSKLERLCRYITRPPVAAEASRRSIQQGLRCRVNWPTEWFGCASGGAP